METTATVTNIRTMTEAAYKHHRAKIEAKYPKGGNLSALKDQALADLFYRSNWTQEQLAKIEGVKQAYISRRVLFGRFIAFMPGRHNHQIPVNLTEFRFRGYWSQTKEEGSEAKRFRKVAHLIEDVTEIIAEHAVIKEGKGLPTNASKRIIEKFGDGHWHGIETIAKHIDNSDIKALSIKLSLMKTQKIGKCLVEKRKYGTSFQYRIVKGGGATIDFAHLQKEIGPILDKLEFQGSRSKASMSPPTVMHLTHQIKRLIEKLAG